MIIRYTLPVANFHEIFECTYWGERERAPHWSIQLRFFIYYHYYFLAYVVLYILNVAI